MKFTSTRNKGLSINFSQAILNCMPEDGGLYVPQDTTDLRRWILYIDENTPFTSIAGTLTSALINDEFSPIICETIAMHAFKFAPEIKQLDENLFMLELYHGPTGIHKDFGISYLASSIETILQLRGGSSIFLDVSQGETGASLAVALRDKKNLKSVVLYPKGCVRGLEESDYFWNGGNIYPIEIEGTIDDCREMVKKIFSDRNFIAENHLTVANTTNIGRLLPQAFFYPYAFSRIKSKVTSDIHYALASGNYSNVVAGLFAWQFALPLNGFIVPATSSLGINPLGDPILLDSVISLEKRFPADPSSPSNLERLENIFATNSAMMKHFIYPYAITEKDVSDATKELFMKYKIYADRHTARAYAASKIHHLQKNDEMDTTILVARDNPVLSKDFVRMNVGEEPEMSSAIEKSLRKVKIKQKAISTETELRKIIQMM